MPLLVSNRLTGGPSNTNCLNALESGGMGEGWGDFMATAIRLKAGDTAAKDYPMGAWVYNHAAGIRDYPYSTSTKTNPYTYTSVNSMSEVHDIGTVWATMLYEVLWGLIAKHGKNDGPKPSFDSKGVPTDGKYLAMKLVMDGMALYVFPPIHTPIHPFYPARAHTTLSFKTTLQPQLRPGPRCHHRRRQGADGRRQRLRPVDGLRQARTRIRRQIQLEPPDW